jgi:hypothetical protein
MVGLFLVEKAQLMVSLNFHHLFDHWKVKTKYVFISVIPVITISGISDSTH